MDYKQLRQKYPKFVYTKYNFQVVDDKLELEFYYQIPQDHAFVHKLTFENLHLVNTKIDESLIFHIGLAEMFSYWKTTCSPHIEIQAGYLSPEQITFWHKLLLKGMGQYFYENQIDFTSPNFLTIISSGPQLTTYPTSTKNKSVLVPIGGGKDSVVTAEILKNYYSIQPIIVYPATPASKKVSAMLTNQYPILVYRVFDKHMIEMNNQGYLTGHIPYSAILAFIFLLTAQIENIPYIVVSNERSSDESNVTYLGQEINHQYSKSSEFETDLNVYIKSLNFNLAYFSFLRPLYELQIAQLFSKMTQYFSVIRSCNKNQQQDSWCGRCPKCVSITMTLEPWAGEENIKKIFNGINPLKDPQNQGIIHEMTDLAAAKPFECITTTEEAQICLEFIVKGQTPRVKEFLSRWGDAPKTPPQFLDILQKTYANS